MSLNRYNSLPFGQILFYLGSMTSLLKSSAGLERVGSKDRLRRFVSVALKK